MKTTNQQKGTAPPITVAFAVWGAILIALFLSTHFGELKKLPTLTAAATTAFAQGGALDYTQLFYSFGGVVAASSILLCWYGVGDLIFRFLGEREDHRALAWATKSAWGAGCWSLIWMVLGLLRLYRVSIAGGALIGGIALFAYSTISRRNDGTRPTNEVRAKRARGEQLFFALSLAVLTMSLIAALAPPTAKDTLLYHFALPKAYVAANALVEVPYNIAGYLPLGAEMHSVWAMLLGRAVSARVGEAAAGVLQFAFFPLLLLGVYGWTRVHVGDKRWAMLSATMIATIPTAYHVAANAYVDLALALYSLLAAHAAGRWWVKQDAASLARLSLAIGFALCVKLTAVFLIFPTIILILFKINAAQKSGESAAKLATTAAAALFGAILLASPWYLKTWAQTGSPVFPFYVNIWEGRAPGWDVERSLMFQTINSTYGGYPKTIADYLLAPLKLSVTAKQEEPANFDGVLGTSFLLGLPILVWAWRSPRFAIELKIASAFSGALFLCWLFSSQQLRYLLPALPGLAVSAACAAELFCANLRPKFSRLILPSFTLAALAAAAVICVDFLPQNPLSAVVGIEDRSSYLTRRLDYYPYYETVNRDLPAAARVWLVNMRRDTYHLERPYFSDYMFEDYTLQTYVRGAGSVGELREKVAREPGASALLIRHDVLLDYRRSPVVDDRVSGAENNRRVGLLLEFLAGGSAVKSDSKFALLRLDAAH